jgi:hypothetical protein
MMPTNTVGDPYLPDADNVDLKQVQNKFPLSCSMTDNQNNDDDTNPATSSPLLSSQESATQTSYPQTKVAVDDDTSLFDYLTNALSNSIPDPYAYDFYVPILQETFN